jgi:hypothetical protein
MLCKLIHVRMVAEIHAIEIHLMGSFKKRLMNTHDLTDQSSF